MSYHEYLDSRGNLHRRHDNGHRLATSTLDPGDFPDGPYWQAQAELAFAALRELLGDDYCLWAEVTWPEKTIDDLTWKEIHAQARQALLIGKSHLLDELECRCVLPEQACPVCRAQARLIYGGK